MEAKDTGYVNEIEPFFLQFLSNNCKGDFSAKFLLDYFDLDYSFDSIVRVIFAFLVSWFCLISVACSQNWCPAK